MQPFSIRVELMVNVLKFIARVMLRDNGEEKLRACCGERILVGLDLVRGFDGNFERMAISSGKSLKEVMDFFYNLLEEPFWGDESFWRLLSEGITGFWSFIDRLWLQYYKIKIAIWRS